MGDTIPSEYIDDEYTDNYVTNQLILKYDQNFNEKYNKLLTLNSSIMNKEELILKENDEIIYKNNSITILKYTLYLIVVIGLLFILKSMQKMTNNNLMISIIILIIIYFVVIYFSVYSKFNLINAQKELKGIEVNMANYINNLGAPDLTDYQCPTKCTKVSNNAPTSNIIQPYSSPTLITDSQTNVWKYGDIPEGGYNKYVTPEEIYQSPTGIPNYQSPLNEPRSAFGTTYPRTTYYQCEWLGGSSSGLPNAESTYSTIPCTYRENYHEVGRYICSQDPNISGNTNSCENVSLSIS